MKPPHTTYGTGSSLLFAFHGYGMDGRQFQVLKESLCADYFIVGFHLPYHKGGPVRHEGWFASVIETIKQILDEKNADQCSFAGYSIGVKVALSLLPHFDGQIKNIHLFAPYGLVQHWGISFLESGLGKGLFRMIAGLKWPLVIINAVHRLGVICKADHAILVRELETPEKRHNLRKIFLLLSELKMKPRAVLNALELVDGKVQLVFGNQDNIFPRTGLKGDEKLDKFEILEVEEGHWLMTEKLDELLTTGFREKILLK